MREERLDGGRSFLSTLPAGPSDRRRALAVVAVSLLVFGAAVPFARVPLTPVWAFIPIYQSALAVVDLITAILLIAQAGILRSRGLLALAAGYLFTAILATIHSLTFPGLFASAGLIGAGPQTTAWLYMFWHAGFPLMVIVYAVIEGGAADRIRGSFRRAVALTVLAVVLAAAVLAMIATAGHDRLPAIMAGNRYTPIMSAVVTSVWGTSLLALYTVLRRRPHSVLDVWLMVVLCAWLLDIALAAVLNGGRFDLGFYVGRIYGLLAASFVLIVLLLETGALYAQLARLLDEERRRAAAEISDINARLAALLDASPLPIFSLDAEGRIATWNPAAERGLGHAPAAVIGRTLAALAEPSGEIERLHGQVMQGEQVKDAPLRWRAAGDRMRDIVYSAAPVRGAGGRIAAAVYVAEDVTDKKKLEAQLARSQRMDAVGQLTGGIAHDFNNLLTVVIGNLDLLIEALHAPKAPAPKAPAGERERLANDALEAALRGAELVRRLLAFARNQPLQPRPIEVEKLLGGLETLLLRTLGEHIVARVEKPVGLWPVVADPSQLENAILNLAINARDAMPDGGRLSVSCANVTIEQAGGELQPGDYVAIAVSDTGTGIPPDVLARVFEPFFTTKPTGKGSGLGLSMVYGFARQSGGSATIYSEPGKGTEVRIFYLPRAADAALAAAEPAVRARAAARPGQRILVVEDKPDVRMTAMFLLESLGYQPREAASGEAALALLDRGERFDLLFTDVVMPGTMTGVALAHQVRRRFPDMPIVFTSGFSNPEMTAADIAALGAIFISKPYGKTGLDAQLRAALARRTPAGAT